tara:strand:+ start:7011 stop:10754 length:3744 start_codon:yes stop_codon:yes gene_type:complete
MNHQDQVNQPGAEINLSPLPERPYEALQRCAGIGDLLGSVDPASVVEQLACHLLDPANQAFTIRLDWAIRMTLALAHGQTPPTRKMLDSLLNDLLAEGGVLRREDPPEEMFSNLFLTPRGNIPLLNGGYGCAVGLTQLVYDAFTSLPDALAKSAALKAVDALLTAVRIISERALSATEANAQTAPSGRIPIREDYRGTRLTESELSAAGISLADLAPFLISAEGRAALLNQQPGNSALEITPLLQDGSDVLVAAPHLIALAVRAYLARISVRCHVDRPLQHALAKLSEKRLMDFGLTGLEMSPDEPVDGWLLYSMLAALAPGRWLHIIHTVEPFEDAASGQFGLGPVQSPGLKKQIDQQIAQAHKFAGSEDGIDTGLTLWITSGWARGAEIEVRTPGTGQDWQIAAINPIDLGYIAIDSTDSLQTIWRMAHAYKLAGQDGTTIQNLSGFANLYSWWRSNGYSFFPDGMPDNQLPVILQIPFDSIRQLRMAGEHRAGFQARPGPGNRIYRTLKFDRDAENPVQASKFAAIDEIQAGRLLGGVELTGVPVWIEAVAASQQVDSELVYGSWDGAMNWLAFVLDNKAVQARLGLLDKPILCQLLVSDPGEEFGATPERESIPDLLSLTIDNAASVFRLSIDGKWHWALQHLDNVAELDLAAAMLEGLSQLAPAADLNRNEARALLSQFAESPQFRWRHGQLVRTATDLIVASRLMQSPHRIPNCAKAHARNGRAGLIGLSGEATGSSACRSAASDYRDSCLGELILTIRHFDKQVLLEMCLDYHQRAIGELRIWEYTAAASAATLGEVSDFNISFLNTQYALEMIRASSILTELAISEAGKCQAIIPTPMQIDELLALSLEAFLGGDTATALANGRGPGRISVSQDGQVHIDGTFVNTSMRPLLDTYHGLRRNHAVRSQSETQPEDERDNFENESAELSTALEAEYGVSLDDLRNLSYGFSLIASDHSRPVMQLSLADWASLLSGMDFFETEDLTGLLKRLTLFQRKSYFSDLGKLTPRDVDLARYSRPYSLISRPLAAITDDADPLLMVAPVLVQRSFEFILSGALSGILQGDFWASDEMRRYTGKRGSEIGLAFNRRVAETARSAGLVAYDSVSPTWATNAKSSDETKRLGDIDVLAVDQRMNRIWVIEAKDLQLCRTQGETARRMADYQGITDDRSRPDKLLRHLRRVAYVRRHAAQCCRRLGLTGEPEVRGLLVLSLPQPLSLHQSELDSKSCMLHELVDTLNEEKS